MGLFTKRRRVRPLFIGSNGNDLTRGIYVFHVDIDNGEFLKKKFYKSTANPCALFRRERFIYTCYLNNTGRPTDGGLWQYASMELQFGLAGRVSHQGKTFIDCYVNEDRTYAYAVDYYNGEVVTIPILKQKIVKVSQAIQHTGHGLDEKRQATPHPHFIDMTPDKKRIVVCDLGTDEIVMYKVIENGQLERDDDHSIQLEPGSGPRKIIFSKNGQYAYVVNELSNKINVYIYNDCTLTLIQEVNTFPKEDYSGVSLAGDIILTNDNQYLFVTNRGHDSVTAYEVDSDNGKLHYIENIDTDENPRCLEIIENRWLIVASQKGGTIESFEIKRNESKGILFETHFSYAIGEPVCMIEGRSLMKY